MAIKTITPDEACKLLSEGATLVDIRPADEHAREKIPGGKNVPLDSIEHGCLPEGAVVFHCRSGMRTSAHASRLEQAAGGRDCYILSGGIESWRKAGHSVEADKSQPIEIMRQVQLAAGALVLIGVLLGFMAAPVWFGLSAFVGAGLMMTGATGWCGMATLLRAMPWNRRAQAA